MKNKIYISIDEKEFFWVIVENSNIIKNPSREELNKISTRYYSKTNICSRCREENNITDRSILYPGNAHREKDDNGKETGGWVCSHHRKIYYMYGLYEKPEKYYNDVNRCEFIEEDGKRCLERLYPRNACQKRDKERKKTGEWVCKKHYDINWQRYDPNSTNNTKKKLANCRTRNQDPNHECTKGDRDIEVVCETYGYVNLNKKYDKYNTEIDCLDEKTGLLYQIRGRCYDPINRLWSLSELEREWYKEYEDMICFCKSKDGKKIEEIYRFHHKTIKEKRIKGISIFKYDSKGRPYKGGWYEQYRVKDPEELKKANDILQEKLEEDENRRRKLEKMD